MDRQLKDTRSQGIGLIPLPSTHTQRQENKSKIKEMKRDPCVLYPFEMTAFLRTITQIH